MNYLFGTGLIGAITAGTTLLRGTRHAPITWRGILAWVSWGITLALAIGAVIDTRRAEKGVLLPPDSPIYAKQQKELEKEAKSRKKQRGRSAR
jgi:hypothetical protein